ncbi:MAG: tRNA 2-thiouridine(34) synthase MnmA [Ruminococcaceae bacterium]|nr:tRNA 2-thiouridine(34) synthase MnmA [Oscillospiraceae bacterium]
MKKALIAMSGGVDSSVAAVCMTEAGYACRGVTMRLHDYGTSCGAATEAADAAGVAEKLGFPFEVLDCRAEFEKYVIEQFVTAYEAGDTPNPCIRCNRYLKFSLLHEYAKEQGCDTVVTGHYARVTYDESTGKYHLKKAKNLAKDQTYVLYFLTQEQLARTAFPLGDMPDKDTVRQRATDYGFAAAHKKDSQDICFIPDGKYADFIRRRTGRAYPPGAFVDADGRVLGQHKGLIGYTIGQRKGLGLALPAPLYVRRKCRDTNTVLLTPECDLYSDTLVADGFNWVSGETPAQPVRVTAKTRYSAKEAPATVTALPDGKARVVFDTPQRAVTTGQAVVLYDGDDVIGGGTIREVEG